MSDIQRWRDSSESKLYYNPDKQPEQTMKKHKAGKWVKYSDHIKEIELLKKPIEDCNSSNDFQRYHEFRYLGSSSMLACSDGEWIKKLDYLKAIEAKDKEIAEDKTYISGLESIVKYEKKEIERLKKKIDELSPRWTYEDC